MDSEWATEVIGLVAISSEGHGVTNIEFGPSQVFRYAGKMVNWETLEVPV